jgi:hypothetical protein
MWQYPRPSPSLRKFDSFLEKLKKKKKREKSGGKQRRDWIEHKAKT